VFLLIGIIAYYGIIEYRKRSKRLQKYKTSTLDPGRAEKIIPKLRSLMENEKVYLDPDLTLKSLAQKLHIHSNHLSRIINERFEMGYNDYINKYRIEEAKERLSDPAEAKKGITEIMYETGFYSKSVFNTAFKKYTGMTPSAFRRSQRLQ
jgi:AraC-like DNA-binding protein